MSQLRDGRVRQRVMLILLVGMLVATVANAGVTIKRDPANIDRPGGDFQRTLLPHADSELCVNQCVSDTHCLSYTYVKPGLQDKQAVCYLKNTRRPIVKNNCCVSGIKAYVADPKPRARPAEIQPPDASNQQWCTTSLVCGNRQGHWNANLNSCDCGDPPSRGGPTDANGIPTTREAD